MLTISLMAGFKGRDTATAEWAGRKLEARCRAPVREIARLLVNAGAGDEPWQTVRGEVVGQAGASLYELGGLDSAGQIVTAEANMKIPIVRQDAAKAERLAVARAAAEIYLR
jgi:hypothetical protein